MASLRKLARTVPVSDAGKDSNIDGVLEMSVTVGYLGADVNKEELSYLERLLQDHTEARLVSIERGELEQHLHFKMVCRARVKSARGFGVLVRKYMKWYGVKNMAPIGKVTCKVLTNRLIHTWKGMIGYCLNDSGTTHFQVAMKNISDDEVIAGKTLHSIYGKADLKQRVCLTPKNVGERAYVWLKYNESRLLTATFLSTLTDMVNSAMFVHASQWIVPCNGQSMDQPKMNAYWNCLTDHVNVIKSDTAEIFVNTREQFKSRYYAEEEVLAPVKEEKEEYTYGGSPPSRNVPQHRSIPRSLNVPAVERSDDVNRSGYEVTGRNILPGVARKLYFEPSHIEPFAKAPKTTGSDFLDFIPLKEKASFPTNVFLPTVEALSAGHNKKQAFDEEFWHWLDSCKEGSSCPPPIPNPFESMKAAGLKVAKGPRAGGEEGKIDGLYYEEIDGLYHEGMELIILSSDSEGEDDSVSAAYTVKPAAILEDRNGDGEVEVPKYTRGDNIMEAVYTTEQVVYKTHSRN